MKVEVDLWVTSFEVYRKDWKRPRRSGEAASPSDCASRCIRVGKPFNLSLNQLEFIKPDIDVGKAVKDLLPI